MKASDFDKKFDAGESVITELDVARARRPGEEVKRINVDFPAWMVAPLDKEERRLGVTRQPIIKM
jgi:hypothetical protein